MPKSFTPKTVAWLKKSGDYVVWSSMEHYNTFARKHTDLLGFIDAWAYDPEHGHIWIQTTSRGQISVRKKKIIEDHLEKAVALAVMPYNRIMIHGWDKPKHRWRLKEVDITKDIQDAWLAKLVGENK